MGKDLKSCGVEVEDERGYRVDFHVLCHTFVSLLAYAKGSDTNVPYILDSCHREVREARCGDPAGLLRRSAPRNDKSNT